MIIGEVLISSVIVALLGYADNLKRKALLSRRNSADKEENRGQVFTFDISYIP